MFGYITALPKVHFLCILAPNDRCVCSLKYFTTIMAKSETKSNWLNREEKCLKIAGGKSFANQWILRPSKQQFSSLKDFPSFKLKFLKCQFSEEHHTIAIQSISNVLNRRKKERKKIRGWDTCKKLHYNTKLAFCSLYCSFFRLSFCISIFLSFFLFAFVFLSFHLFVTLIKYHESRLCHWTLSCCSDTEAAPLLCHYDIGLKLNNWMPACGSVEVEQGT